MINRKGKHLLPLAARRMGIDTHQELTIYLPSDSHVCHSEGFSALSRVRVESPDKQIIATLHIVTNGLLQDQEIGFSESAWAHMELTDGDQVWVYHPKPLESLSHIRAKIFGHRLTRDQIDDIVRDIAKGRYADVHLAAFISSCGDGKLDVEEIIDLTRAMVEAGSKLEWDLPVIVDKHCVGGLPGNRTTPILVPILAAAGLSMPKTSSRAITSPAGTADTMETLTNVRLDLDQIRVLVKTHGGCLAWGGSVRLSPTDDLLIRVERALEIDSEGQLIASVLSKKLAAGATHVLIDIPVGSTAKIRDQASAERLSTLLRTVAETLGLKVRIMISDGSQPVGNGIGPALEAWDILAVLQNKKDAPQDLKIRAAEVAGELLEMCSKAEPDKGFQMAVALIDSGAAWKKFQEICQAQGGLQEPPVAPYRYNMISPRAGVVSNIDNRQLSQTAKLAGAPADPAAGVVIYAKLGNRVKKGETLLTIHAESPGELDYAVAYLNTHRQLITVSP
ncbi:thymidine phosphorylase family protein [Motiliproteus sp. MSK22-1]|uniref:thymidine phosphorylase family protein n=1 Tax=Motiliproteus sp. MSK22-1 TaxID=1897630 RepID=UPI00097553F0|nr:thymidine phosphorylase family protein [Motiliproteus sp. MSK22-1]OMH33957.1 thymidine phosphorylase [Motiliproteus sp. MSK22-1]